MRGPDTLLRGRDFLPALLDENVVLSSDYYGAYSTKHQSVTHMRVYSDGKYKLVRDFRNEGRDEFYDLRNDPEETANQIDNPEFQERIGMLSRVIRKKMEETNDPVLSEL